METPSNSKKKSANDFIFGKLMGEGSFSTVFLGQDILTKNKYAIKVCEKKHIIKENKQIAIFREREIMNILTQKPSPYFIKLFCTFQDESRLFFVMSYAKNGELLSYLKKVGSCPLETAVFYSAEIIEALDHLHNLGIIHRDLKPQNLLLDEGLHIKISDFGSAKNFNYTEEMKVKRRNSFVGTAHYVSPEILSNKVASTSSDLWSLGCIIYQLIANKVPFKASNDYLIFQKILKLEYEIPNDFPVNAKELITKLLVFEPEQRLGADEVSLHYISLRKHPFFQEIDWKDLHLQSPSKLSSFLSPNEDDDETMNMEGLKPGFDDQHLNRLLDLSLHDEASTIVKEKEELLAAQAKDNIWHSVVENNLILKQGVVDRRKGYFSRRRMLILTTGPRLYYCEPSNLTVKRQIPWTKELRVESKNTKTFYIYTRKKTYHLEDPEGKAVEWVDMIEELHNKAYSS